jgi:type VI secretion system protein ImpC
MADSQTAAAPATTTEQVQEKGLLDQIVEEGRFGVEPASKERGKNLVKEFVAQVLDGSMTIARDAEMMINARIAQIDHLVSLQLNEVMHNASFQKLEGTWRGVKYLMDQSETGDDAEDQGSERQQERAAEGSAAGPGIRSERSVQESLRRRVRRVRRSAIRRLVGDYEFGKHPEDIELLEKVSNVAAAAHAPFCSAASPDLFNLPSYTSLDAPRDLAKIFDTTEYAKWKSFRQTEDSRYVALCLPARWAGCLTAKTPSRWKLQLRRARGWQRPLQVPVDECGVRAGQPHDQFVFAVWHVRSHARRGRRRPGGPACRCITSTPTKATWP